MMSTRSWRRSNYRVQALLWMVVMVGAVVGGFFR
jgi:hypothetical protein